MQGVEIGDAVSAKHHGLAVNDELLVPVLQCRLDDPGKSLRPVVTAPRNQPNAIAAALDSQAVAVILDLVEPVRAGWNLYSLGGQAELKRLKHAPKIGLARWNCESQHKGGPAISTKYPRIVFPNPAIELRA